MIHYPELAGILLNFAVIVASLAITWSKATKAYQYGSFLVFALATFSNNDDKLGIDRNLNSNSVLSNIRRRFGDPYYVCYNVFFVIVG